MSEVSLWVKSDWNPSQTSLGKKEPVLEGLASSEITRTHLGLTGKESGIQTPPRGSFPLIPSLCFSYSGFLPRNYVKNKLKVFSIFYHLHHKGSQEYWYG